MIAFLSILLAVVLLGITVYGLHRYQTMEVEYTVDRSTPLPPLDGDKGESDRRAFDPAVNGDSPGKQAVDRRHASATRNPKSTQTCHPPPSAPWPKLPNAAGWQRPRPRLR